MKKSKDQIKEAVKDHYGKAVRQRGGCCAQATVQIATGCEYSPHDLADLPDNVASFGCGNPVALMNVKEGDVVLDLGSGAGLDLILAARKVGPAGRVIGLDMTPEMIEQCHGNLEKAGVYNGELRKGEMENMPVEDNEIDWIISNCVINLSPDKERVFAEAFRVLKPGGQVAISDIVTEDLPEDVREDIGSWVGCIGGAIEEEKYLDMMRQAGFEDVKVVARQTYTDAQLRAFIDECGEAGCGTGSIAGKVSSVRIYARKP